MHVSSSLLRPRIYVLFHLASDDGARRVEQACALVEQVLGTIRRYSPVAFKDLLLPMDSPLLQSDCDSKVRAMPALLQHQNREIRPHCCVMPPLSPLAHLHCMTV